MNSLINGDSRSSRSIVYIACELRTSTAYLLGKVDDLTIDAPIPPGLPVQDRRLVAAAETLKSAERAFILKMLETLQQKRTTAPDMLELPAEEILTAMFQGMFDQIDALDPALSRDEQARLLAQMLPIALSQTEGAYVVPDPAASKEHPEDAATQHHAKQH